MTAAVDLIRAGLARFVEIQGVDRAMALAAQCFSALIPLLIVYRSVVPVPDGADFASALVESLELDGEAARSVEQAFAAPVSSEGIGVIGALLLLVSALAFTRGLQRLYEHAYRLPSRGMRGTRAGLAWLAAVVAFVTVRPVVAGIFDVPGLRLLVSVALALALWTVTPYILLGRRIGLRALLPGALLAAAGNIGLAFTSALWLPESIADSAAQYGVIGVAFALLSWVVAASFVLVASTTGGAVVTERLRAARALSGAAA